MKALDIQKHIRFFIVVLYILLGYFFLTEIFPGVVGLLLPFIFAFIVAAIANPLARLLRERLKFPKILATALSLLFILSVLSGIITVAVNRLISELTYLLQSIPNFSEFLTQRYYEISQKWEIFHKSISPEFSAYAAQLTENITETLTELLKSLTKLTINSATSIASKIPSILLVTVAFILACIFITNDYDKIKHSIMLQFPKSAHEKITMIKNYASNAFRKYLKSMLIIMMITFFELLLGMMILGVEYAFTFAIIIAVVDILPIFGTGTILIPWGIVSLIFGNYHLGFGLLILYGIITVIRQFIEPKIISSSLGTYPLLTLMAIYVGYKIFGISGMIMMPIAVLIIVSLNDAGVIKIWKTEQ